jgi:hypothetical protein
MMQVFILIYITSRMLRSSVERYKACKLTSLLLFYVFEGGHGGSGSITNSS